jgi:tRNA(fMet)-specific endonuclease VapC
MPLRYLLDTNILSSLIKNPHGAVTSRLSQLRADAICTSIVVACELRYGAAKRGSAVLTQRVEDLLGAIAVIPFDGDADREYANIRAALERAGQTIGGNDLLIAAHARALDLTLVTHNTREFERVAGLQLEDWLEGE